MFMKSLLFTEFLKDWVEGDIIKTEIDKSCTYIQLHYFIIKKDEKDGKIIKFTSREIIAYRK